MRHVRFASIALLALASVVPVACGSSSDNASALPANDAGTSDAPLPSVDGGGDASEDAGPVEDAGAGVMVQVVDLADAGIAAVLVLGHDEAGIATSSVSTDSSGLAHFEKVPSMVTVVTPTSVGATNFTWMGVEAGDLLRYVWRGRDGVTLPDPQRGSLSVSFAPGQPLVESTVTTTSARLLFGECDIGPFRRSDYPPPYAISLTTTCAAKTDNLVVSLVTTDGGVEDQVAFAYSKNIVTPPKGSVATLDPVTFAAPGSRTVKGIHIPTIANRNAQAIVGAGAGSTVIGLEGSGLVTEPAGRTFRTPIGYAEFYQTLWAIFPLTEQPRSWHVEGTRREIATSAAAGDLAPVDFDELIPPIDDATVAASPVDRPVVTISSPPSTRTTATYVTVTWMQGVPNFFTSWSFMMPGHVTSFTPPAMISGAEGYAPMGHALGVAEVFYVGGTTLPDYKSAKDQLRERGFALLYGGIMTGPSGTHLISSSTSP